MKEKIYTITLWENKTFASPAYSRFTVKIYSGLESREVTGQGASPHIAYKQAENKLICKPWLESKESEDYMEDGREGQMTEHPIIFSSEMVSAILEGRKTMTRRVLNPQPSLMALGAGTWYPDSDYKKKKHYATIEHFKKGVPLDFCPYGQVGDHLWVRECWAQDYTDSPIRYMADIKHPDKANFDNRARRGWKPSIHMPRAFSRITLEITNIKVERVQEITEEDAIKEGVEVIKGLAGDFYKGYSRSNAHAFNNPTLSFYSLWDSINGKKHPWSSNPFVWVLTFKKI